MESLLFAIPILAVFIAITMVAPSWRWCAGFIVCVSGALICLWLQHWHATTMPGCKEGPGGGLGILIVASLTQAFVISVAIYFVGLAWLYGKE